MNYYYIQLPDPCAVVNFIGEVEYQTKANNMICGGDFYIDNNMPEYYPDLVFSSTEEVLTAVVDGESVPVTPLTSGYHPAHRPPPRHR